MTDNNRKDAYREAGVDINLEAQAVKALVSQLTFHRNGEYQMSSDIGHFAGFVSFGSHVLALAVDGVGTKMLIADELAVVTDELELKFEVLTAGRSRNLYLLFYFRYF